MIAKCNVTITMCKPNKINGFRVLYLARQCICDYRTLGKALRGVKPVAMVGKYPLFTLKQAHGALGRYRRPKKQRQALKDQLVEAQIARIRHKLEVDKAQYVPAAKVKEWAAQAGRHFKNVVLAGP